MELAFDNLALLILIPFLAFVWFFVKWSSQFKKPSLLFPDLKLLVSHDFPSFKKKFSNLPTLCLWIAFSLLAIAFIDPHYFALKGGVLSPNDKPPEQGIAIYLVADESGSMMEEISAKGLSNRNAKIAKIDLLKQVTVPFIESRKNDLIGLIAFSRTADVRTPLTLEHQDVIQEISELRPSIDERDGGTAMGYAVFKTVNLILATKHFANDLIKKGKPAYDIENTIIVLVTDGVQNVNPDDVNDPFRSMDILEAAIYAKKNDVRLYIINVDPSILTKKFTPERNLMNKVTDLTGGHFYVVDQSNSLSEIYAEINKIEKSEIQDLNLSKDKLPEIYKRVSLYPFFIGFGMCFILLSLIFETTYFKRVP